MEGTKVSVDIIVQKQTLLRCYLCFRGLCNSVHFSGDSYVIWPPATCVSGSIHNPPVPNIQLTSV